MCIQRSCTDQLIGFPETHFSGCWSQLHLEGENQSVQIGVCLEPLDELSRKEIVRLGSKEDFAKRVAQNLYHFMTSFGTVQNGDQVVVPANCFERYMQQQEHFLLLLRFLQ